VINAHLDVAPDLDDVRGNTFYYLTAYASTAGFEDLEKPPGSLDDFRQLSTALFSESFLERQRQSFAWLKAQLSAALVDDLVAMQSYSSWLEILVDTMLNGSVPVDTRRYTGHATGDTQTTLEVRQITLRGKTLKKAWKNFMTEHGSEYHLLDDQDANWTPDQTSTAHSFYGTTPALYDDTLSSSLLHNLIAVPYHERMNDLAPYKRFHTEFSATRAFSCAVFRATMVATGTSEGCAGLEHMWRCNDEGYAGILMLQFATSTPASAGQRGFCVPKAIIESWKTTVQQIVNERPAAPMDSPGLPCSELWNNERLAKLHGEQNTLWPDVVHGPERGLRFLGFAPGLVSCARMTMGNTGHSAWRTVHFSKAAHEHLKQNLVGIYAIQYVAESTKYHARLIARLKSLKYGH